MPRDEWVTSDDAKKLADAARPAAKANLDRLKKISDLVKQANSLWREVDDVARTAMDDLFNPEASLGHCLRWAETASDELIQETKRSARKATSRR